MPLHSLKLIAAGVALAAIIGAFFYGRNVGIDSVLADQAREDKIIAQVTEASQKAAAGEIAKIEVKNVTIRQKLETEIRKEPVYVDCRHSADGLRLINEAITGNAEPPRNRELPRTSTTDGR